jgi:hypothetical protein
LAWAWRNSARAASISSWRKVVVFLGPAETFFGYEVGRLGLVPVGGGDDFPFKQILHTPKILSFFSKICLGLGHGGLSLFDLLRPVAGLQFSQVGPGGHEAGLGRLHFPAQILGLEFRQNLPGFDFLAFLEVDGGDFAGHLEAYISLRGLDVARKAQDVSVVWFIAPVEPGPQGQKSHYQE